MATGKQGDPILITSSGQRINWQDPNYTVYRDQGAAQMGGTSGGGTTAASDVAASGSGTPGNRPPDWLAGFGPAIAAANAAINVAPVDATQGMLDIIQQFLDRLQNTGQTINPNVVITPELAAEFLAQAGAEIDPYYASQLSLAREGFLRSVGYSAQQVAEQEKTWEKKYGQNVRTLGINAAESGTVLSGQRNLDERNLAQDTQTQVNQARDLASFNAGTLARSLAEQWGQTGLPATTTIGTTPNILPGQESWQASSGTSPFYELNPDVYAGLVGTKQWEQQEAKRKRAYELEGAWRTNQSINSARTLNL